MMKPSTLSEVRALIHASELYTGAGIRRKDGRHPQEADLGVIVDGAIVYSVPEKGVTGEILWVGYTDDLPEEYRNVPTEDLGNQRAVSPGLIDSHTHLVFAGDRANDFARRAGGESYQQIAAEGGGILRTVQATRNATEDELFRLAEAHLLESQRYGVRTLEAKSGYGLSFEAEMKQLRVVQRLKKAHPETTLVSTYLGAHDFPKDQPRDRYLSSILEEHLPAVARDRLADFCDVFIDEGFYTLEEGREILRAAKKLGLKLKVHADELANTESAALAAELGAHSADHLLKISDEGIRKLAASKTVATLLPGTAFYLKAPYAPARKLLEAGARVAISTDFNPGTCVTLNLPAVLTISALYLGMTRAELFAAVTYNAACALGLEERKGTLEAGKDADFWIMPFARFEEAYYRFAW